MASKRKFAGENSGALVPVKKPKQHQVALLNQGGAIQAVCVIIYNVLCAFDVVKLFTRGVIMNNLPAFIELTFMRNDFDSFLKERQVLKLLSCCSVGTRFV